MPAANKLVVLLDLARRLVLAIAGKLAWLPPLLARAVVGFIFVESGWGKLHNLSFIIDRFREWGIPYPQIQAPFSAGTELVCGALLLAGLLSRIAAVPLVVVMIVAICKVKLDPTSTLDDFLGFEEFHYILLLLWIAIAGPGPISLDRIAGPWIARRSGKET
ncbi:MAG: DoxX family protein [Polyangiaceae bacterium]